MLNSFDNGVLFCRLVHAYNPSLLNLNAVNPNRPRENLEMAFQLIEQHLQIPRMLGVEDLLNPDISSRPDEQCIMTYLSQFPEAFLQRPTPEAIPVGNVQLDSLPVSTPPTEYATSNQFQSQNYDYAQINHHPQQQQHQQQPPMNYGSGNENSNSCSLSSHPSLSNVSDSSTADRSQSSFPQLPIDTNQYHSQQAHQPNPQNLSSTSRYSVTGDLPLPPTMNFDSMSSQNQERNMQNHSNSNHQNHHSHSHSQTHSQQYHSVTHNQSGSTNSISNQQSSNSNSPYSSNTNMEQHQQHQQQPPNRNPYLYDTSGFPDNNNNSNIPQRPPVPSAFSDFNPNLSQNNSNPNMYGSNPNIPSRPPPPSMDAFGLSSNTSNPSLGSNNNNNNNTASPSQQNLDLQRQQKEFEEFKRQREEFERQRQEFERQREEFERARKEQQNQNSPLPDQSHQIQKLQSEVSQLKEVSFLDQ